MTASNALTLRPDSKGRVALGNLAKGVSSFRVSQDKQHRIILEPFAEVPAREKWLWVNESALAKVKQGLQQSAAGKTSRLGSFAKHASDDIE